MSNSEQKVFIIDDDDAVRDSMSMLLETMGLPHQCYISADDFLDNYDGNQRGCLVLDIRMSGINGLELQQRLKDMNAFLPIIFITGHGDVPMAVEAMRQGAMDFLRKPIREQDLLERIQEALDYEKGIRDELREREESKRKLLTLTTRERDIFERVADGHANKVIALELGISERTVEVHRSQVMRKLEVRSLAQLVRIRLEMKNAID
jgi:FixJ family two-component response regulator